MSISGFVNLVVRRYVGPFWYRRKWLEQTQWQSKMELESLQLGQLQKLISHCYETVPYYRNLMDEQGIAVGDIRELTDIERFPIMTKDDILNVGETIVSNKYPRIICSYET